MRQINPRHRFEALRNQTKTPETGAERSLYVLLHGVESLNKAVPYKPWEKGCEINSSILYPLEVFKQESIRSVLEAFLISGGDATEIGRALSMPPDEVSAYQELFFDTSVFRTDLELIVFMQQVPEDNPYKNLYRIGFHQGLGALQWHFCRNKPTPLPEEIIKTLMTDTYYRALEHRGLPITGKVAKEALKLARVSMDCAKTLINGGPSLSEEDANSLKVQFEQVRKNRTIADLGDTEILH